MVQSWDSVVQSWDSVVQSWDSVVQSWDYVVQTLTSDIYKPSIPIVELDSTGFQ